MKLRCDTFQMQTLLLCVSVLICDKPVQVTGYGFVRLTTIMTQDNGAIVAAVNQPFHLRLPAPALCPHRLTTDLAATVISVGKTGSRRQ